MAHGAPLNTGLEPYPGYRLTRRIGSGGCGEVWEATVPHRKPVAIKFMQSSVGEMTVREIRSLQAIRQLRHPHLIHIENVWCYEGYVAVAMELADGSLADMLKIYQSRFGTPIIQEHACLLLSEAAEALDYLNARQHVVNGTRVAIQHCDVKPSNLLLCGETVKVADFGLSSFLIARQETRGRAGTLDYCAPEVFQGLLSSQTDQYALAVTYCLVRGGRLPFPDTPASFRSGYVRPIPDLSMLPDTERPVVAKALNSVPQDRWSSCGDFMNELARVVYERAAKESKSSSSAKKSNRYPRSRIAPQR
jgi:serine/threonine-protein kinase